MIWQLLVIVFAIGGAQLGNNETSEGSWDDSLTEFGSDYSDYGYYGSWSAEGSWDEGGSSGATTESLPTDAWTDSWSGSWSGSWSDYSDYSYYGSWSEGSWDEGGSSGATTESLPTDAWMDSWSGSWSGSWSDYSDYGYYGSWSEGSGDEGGSWEATTPSLPTDAWTDSWSDYSDYYGSWSEGWSDYSDYDYYGSWDEGPWDTTQRWETTDSWITTEWWYSYYSPLEQWEEEIEKGGEFMEYASGLIVNLYHMCDHENSHGFLSWICVEYFDVDAEEPNDYCDLCCHPEHWNHWAPHERFHLPMDCGDCYCS